MRAKDLWLEFVDKSNGLGLCGLCGNTGVVDTRGHTLSPNGTPTGVRRYCICPNGRDFLKRVGNGEQLKDE